MKSLDINNSLWASTARRSHLQDKVNNYRDHAQEREDLAERAGKEILTF